MARQVLVTGAGRGIGLEFVKQLTSRGEQVVGTARSEAGRDAIVAAGAEALELDLLRGDTLEQLGQAYADRTLDLLINNAGIGVKHLPLGEIDYAQLARFYEVNAVGPLHLTETLLPALRRSKRALVANLTSRMGSITDNTSGGSYAYRASKAALNMITRSLAIDLADDDIRCVVLHPGWVQTAMGGAAAPLPVEQSVAGMLRTIDNLKPEHSGEFFDYSGERLPW